MKLRTNSVKALILMGAAFFLLFVYIVLQVQGDSSGQATLTVPASISPTSTLVPGDYEQERAAAADYWLRNAHKLPVPPTSSPHPPDPTPTSEPYPISTVEPTSTASSATTTIPSVTEIPFGGLGPPQIQINSPNVPSSRMHLPLVLDRTNEIRVFVVAYMDEPVGRPEFPQLLNDIIADLTEGSRWHGTEMPTVKPIVTNLVTSTQTSPTNSSGQLSFLAVFNAYGLCDKIRNGEIDQVWLFNPGNVPNPVEYAVNGDSYKMWNTFVDMPNCGKARPMFTFVYANYFPSLGRYYPAYPHQAVHSFSHYIEALFWLRKQEDRLYCDFIPANGRIASYHEWGGTRVYYEFPPECSNGYTRSDKYGFTSLALASLGLSSSVVGDVHFPPNTSVATAANEYIYNSTTIVQSIGEIWKWGQNPPTSDLSCVTWKGCTNGNPGYCSAGNTTCAQRRYLIWWLQHIPSKGNDSTDRYGVVRETWWAYLLK